MLRRWLLKSALWVWCVAQLLFLLCSNSVSMFTQSAKKIADDIAKETLAFKGLRVTCKLIIQNRFVRLR